MFAETQSDVEEAVPTGVKLRQCSVIVIGSTCKICGRDFKCESDVAMHVRWRHNVVAKNNDRCDREDYFEDTDVKCNVCSEQLETLYLSRTNRHQKHKKHLQDRKRSRKLRLIFKIGGITMTEVMLDRKYLKLHGNENLLVETGTQTDALESENRSQDNYATNIDLFLADRVMSNSYIQYVRPHTAANRYIVGKFASTHHDTITRPHDAPSKNLSEISNKSNKDSISVLRDGSCEEHETRPSLQENTSRFTVNLASSIDIHDKENAREMNNRKRSANPITRDPISKNKNAHSPNEILLQSDSNYQRAILNSAISISKQKYRSSEDRCNSVGQSNKIAGGRSISESTSSVTKPLEIVIDNEDNNFDEVAKKRPIISLARLNGATKFVKVNSNVDDDVQEVLRITRKKAQSDINHESPNRTEREMLQNTVKEICVSPIQIELDDVYLKKDDTEFITNDNGIDTFDYPMFASTANGGYQFPANIATFLRKTFDKKLNIYLDDLRRYDIKYYNNVREINNNLENYAMHAHEGFLEPWISLETKSRYINKLKTNDNEGTVIID